MNIQEAINMLIFPVFIVPTETKYISFEEYSEARQLAVKALERENPKKPTVKDIAWGENHTPVWSNVCPICGLGQGLCRFDYCSSCGQKLDWEVLNE